jgi:hypothetical protein
VAHGSLICELNATARAIRGVTEVKQSGKVVQLTKVWSFLLFRKADLGVIVDNGRTVVVALLRGSVVNDLAGLLDTAGFTVEYRRSIIGFGLTQDQRSRHTR